MANSPPERKSAHGRFRPRPAVFDREAPSPAIGYLSPVMPRCTGTADLPLHGGRAPRWEAEAAAPADG